MSGWDLNNLRQKQIFVEKTPVICDSGSISKVLTLSHSALPQSESLKMSVASYIDLAPWLNAKLPGEGRTIQLT